jgi:hypothetical protein
MGDKIMEARPNAWTRCRSLCRIAGNDRPGAAENALTLFLTKVLDECFAFPLYHAKVLELLEVRKNSLNQPKRSNSCPEQANIENPGSEQAKPNNPRAEQAILNILGIEQRIVKYPQQNTGFKIFPENLN